MDAPDAPRAAAAVGMPGTGHAGSSGTPGPSGQNRLLAALPHELWQRLQPQLERVHLITKQPLHEPGRPIEHVYFPVSGVTSLFAVMAGGAAIEVATVGNEGFIGVPVFLGAAAATGLALCQIGGEAWRLPAADFRQHAPRDGPLRDLLQRYVEAYIHQLSQSAACERAHSLPQRCARCLLMTHDRVATERFDMTQESLASMLGVRRPTVSQLMGLLRQAGHLDYSRGRVTILDRGGLQAAACECYQVIKDGYDHLLGASPAGH